MKNIDGIVLCGYQKCKGIFSLAEIDWQYGMEPKRIYLGHFTNKEERSMSVTVKYEAIKGRILENAKSNFVQSMRNAFDNQGNSSWELSDQHISVLRGMAATYQGEDPNPYEEIIEAIMEDINIRIWCEW